MLESIQPLLKQPERLTQFQKTLWEYPQGHNATLLYNSPASSVLEEVLLSYTYLLIFHLLYVFLWAIK